MVFKFDPSLNSMSYSKAWNNIPQTPSYAQMLDETDTETSNISAQERVQKYHSKPLKALVFRLADA